jgi:hypothetical protein
MSNIKTPAPDKKEYTVIFKDSFSGCTDTKKVFLTDQQFKTAQEQKKVFQLLIMQKHQLLKLYQIYYLRFYFLY